jgi:hypothetical protein
MFALSALASTINTTQDTGEFSDISKPTNTPVIVADEPVQEVVQPQQAQGNMVEVHYSHYTPWVGGTNCANFQNGKCISNTASGQPWPNWLETGVACIKEWPFYTKIQAFGKTWTCVDRGGKIRYDDFKYFDGIPWIDFLTAYPQVPYGTIIIVEVLQ